MVPRVRVTLEREHDVGETLYVFEIFKRRKVSRIVVKFRLKTDNSIDSKRSSNKFRDITKYSRAQFSGNECRIK